MPATRLMHCLISPSGLALSIRLALGLSAFFPALLHAQQAQQVSAASAERGMAIYNSKCIACHSVDEHRVGPAHAGVLGRKAGKAAGYAYSDALSKSQLVWSTNTLQAWLTDPEKLIPGQRMGYSLSLAQERADVVAYLATLKAPAKK